MASVTFDSELMTQQVAAVAVPNSRSFVAVRDENGDPMIFTLGSNGVFYLFKQGVNGAMIMVNLSSALKIGAAAVKAFDVTQNPADTTLYLTAASAAPTATNDESTAPQDRLMVLKPFKPADINLAQPDLDLSRLIIPQIGAKATSISAIFLGDDCAPGTYPQLIFAYVPLDDVHKSTDLARIQVDTQFTSWSLVSDLSLPENAFKLVALCPGYLPIGQGVFALYEIQGQLQLVFTTTGLQFPFSVSLQCPSGASSLATFVETTGYTSLLVGGQGLYWWTSAQCQKKGQKGTLVTSDSVFASVAKLYVAQSGQNLSVFATNTSQGVGYGLTTTANPQSGIVTAPLIPNGQGGVFAPLISPDGKTLQLYVADSGGVLSVLMQDTATQLWNKAPFYSPSLTENVNFQAYTVHANITNPDLTPASLQGFLLKSTGWVDIIVNGRSLKVGPSGTPVMTDSDGILTLLIATEDISSYVFTVENIKTGAQTLQSPVSIDPTFKVNEVLGTIKTANDLRNAPLQSGGKLLDGTTVPSDQITEAAKAVVALHSQRVSIQSTESQSRRTATGEPIFHRPGMVRSGKSLGKLVCGFQQHRILAAESIMDMGWDAWHWLESQFQKFASWTIEAAGKAMAFVVEIGGEFLRWAITTVTEVGKAMSWLFDKVLEIAQKIIDWIGFLLDWGDIQKTHLSLVSVVNGSLQSGADNIALIAKRVDNFFDNLEQEVKTALYPQELTEKVADPSTTDGPIVDPQKDTENSVKGNYTRYQFTHGGAANASSIAGSESSDPLYQAWVQFVQPAWTNLQVTMQTISDDLVLLFKNDGASLSVAQVLQKLGVDVLLGIIRSIRTLVVGLVNMGSLILKDFKTYINYPLNIPIFSALYKEFISGGTELSLLDGLAFLLAIPITIFSKVITGHAPPDMTQLDYNGLVNGTITDPSKLLAINSFMSVSATTTNTLKGALDGIAALIPTSTLDLTHGQDPSLSKHSRSSSLLAKFQGPHPLEILLSQEQLRAGITNPIAMDWRLTLGVVSKGASIPTDPSQPGYPIRWISWLIACGNTLIRAAIRKVTVEGVPASARAKALAVIEAINALINFALISAINGLEFTTSEYPGKDSAITTLQTFSSVFDLISTLGTDGAVLAVDPITIGACEVASFTGLGFSTIITGSVMANKVAQGKYNYILEKM